jgi:hypothetical protein
MMDPSEESGSPFHDFLRAEASPITAVQQAYLHRNPANEMSRVLDRALGDLSRLCPDCGSFCDIHVQNLRDCFMRRASELGVRIIRLTSLYHEIRDAGISDTDALCREIYTSWSEMSTLFIVAEPQAMLQQLEVEDGVEEDEEED